MISKELLSKVFNLEVINIIINLNEDITLGQNEVIIIFNDYEQKWNIYELAHKCKEWALSKGCEIVAMADTIKIYRNKYEVYNVTNISLYCLENFFEACEWILKEELRR